MARVSAEIPFSLPRPSALQGWLPRAALALALMAAFILYAPGLGGGFLFDDQPNLALNEALRQARPTWDSALAVIRSGNAGPLGRPVAMLSFAVNVWLTGMNPFWFKLTNVLIHLANGILIYILTGLLLGQLAESGQAGLTPLRRRWIAAATASLWLLHPLNLTSVLYTVQRMTSLAATFTLLGMILYVLGRCCWLRPKPQWGTGVVLMLGGVVGCGALAALSKENGLLIVLFVFLIEWLFFRFRAGNPLARRLLLGGHLLLAGAPVLGGAVWYLGLHLDQLAAGYGGRPFTLAERVLTEPRILWHYVHWLLVPDIRNLGLFHDDIPVSHGLADPPTTLPAVLEWLLAAGLALWAWRKAPVFAFGVLFFLAGHAMESTVFPLELVHEHRNYLPSWGILLMLCYYLLHPEWGRVWAKLRGRMASRGEPLLAVRAAVLTGFVLLAAGGTWARALSWSDQRALVLAEVTHHPLSARANFTAGRVMIETAENFGRDTPRARELRNLARVFYRHANELDDYYLVGRFGLLTLDALDGKPVDRELLADLKAHLRRGPVAANQVYTLTRLLEDDLRDRWNLPAEVLLEAADALLENPRLPGPWRRDVLVAALKVAFRHHAYAQALRYARGQVALDGDDPSFRLNLAQALYLNGEQAAGWRELQKATELDRDGRLAAARAFIEAHMRPDQAAGQAAGSGTTGQ
ncbi:protein O-mannosyl-transferase [Methylomarinovum caldicuralii]|uniref:Protein O-mannosyl-transferase n=1 Tax=Methylomarinovum caldicuralii TaxID=438856 RepID=A0AAU9CXK1_9GAMM|nr:hypothetical protein [Methylomarinovum caldicuralii]BCX82747.1 protein O-mannosyl-transferase [Methylomarinovum caldicuralii]